MESKISYKFELVLLLGRKPSQMSLIRTNKCYNVPTAACTYIQQQKRMNSPYFNDFNSCVIHLKFMAGSIQHCQRRIMTTTLGGVSRCWVVVVVLSLQRDRQIEIVCSKCVLDSGTLMNNIIEQPKYQMNHFNSRTHKKNGICERSACDSTDSKYNSYNSFWSSEECSVYAHQFLAAYGVVLHTVQLENRNNIWKGNQTYGDGKTLYIHVYILYSLIVSHDRRMPACYQNIIPHRELKTSLLHHQIAQQHEAERQTS